MEKPPIPGPPDSCYPVPSSKFTEDLRNYQKKRGATWYDSTQPSKPRVVDSDGATGVVDVQTLTFCWYQRRFQSTSDWHPHEAREEASQAKQRTPESAEDETSIPTKAATQNVPQDKARAEISTAVAEPSQNSLDSPSANPEQQIADC